MNLLEPEFLKKLELFHLISKKLFRGQLKGEQRSTKRGKSVEFADYRNYVIGDDFRSIDWNVYGRLEKFFIKLFLEEEELFVYLLIDSSASMSFGRPISKIDYAKKTAAALAHIGLANLDRVGVAGFSENLGLYQPPLRGKGQIFKVFHQLDLLNPEGKTNLLSCFKAFSYANKRPGLVVIFSDLFDENGYEEALKYLLYKKHDIFLLHILDQEELNPSLTGDLKLIDSENKRTKEMSISSYTLKLYQEKLSNFIANTENFCSRHGVHYLLTNNQASFEEFILNTLRRGSLLK